MKKPRMANSVGHIDDDLITAAAESKKKIKPNWMKLGSLAACFAMLIVAGTMILFFLLAFCCGSDEIIINMTDHICRSRCFHISTPSLMR